MEVLTKGNCRAICRPAIFLMNRHVFAILLVILMAGRVEAAVSVTDFRGKQLALKGPATRIVCLIESALSGLYMLGAEQQVAAVSANIYSGSVFSWYAAMDERIRHKKLPAPGNWDYVSIESVVALKPDLVILWSKQTESIEALESRGIPVYGVFLGGREDIYKEMRDLGVLTGREKRAQEVVSYTRSEVDRFARRVRAIPANRRPGIYFMWAQGNLETSGGGSTVDDLITLSGGRNVCGAIKSEHLVVNLERILSWNPDLIVMWHNERKTPRDVMADPQWQSLAAVKNRRVQEFPEVFLCDLWTLKFQYAVKMVAKWSHPEQFRDVDLEKEQRSMLLKLYGRKFRGL
jgi:iron complex transport system substrate-binding protein